MPSKTLHQFRRLLLHSDFQTLLAYLAWLEETSLGFESDDDEYGKGSVSEFRGSLALCPGKSLRERGTRNHHRHTARDGLADPGRGYVLS